jgi:hypothetical protein
MRTLMRNGILAVALWAAFPTDALAVLGWLEKLSGPGPFTGVQVNVPFACYGTDRLDAPKRKTIYADYDCRFAEEEHPLVIAIDINRLTSNENTLTYVNIDTRDRPDINVAMLVPNVSVSLKLGTRGRVLDVGAGAGALFFSDSGHFFKSFWKPVLQPLRLGVKPLAWISENRRWEVLEVAFNATIIGGSLRAGDFGAVGGLDESNELVWNRAILIDFYKWFASRKQP